MKKYRLLGVLLAGVLAAAGVPAVTQPLTASVSAAVVLAPKGVTAAATDTKIKLTWKAVKGADAYGIYMTNGYNDNDFIAVKTVSGTSCTIEDLAEGRTYRFKVASLMKVGKEYVVQAESGAVKATTKISAPKTITVSASEDSVLLSWSGGTYSSLYGYRVYKYNSKTGKYAKYKDVKTTSCLISGLKEGTYYKFRIAALVKEGTKLVPQIQSGVISVTPSKPKKAELPEFPAYGKSSAAVLKEMGIKEYTISSTSSGGTIYICGAVESGLILGGASGGTLLLFDDSDRFAGGVYIASMSSFNVLSALDQLRAKHGNGISGSDGDAEMFFWQKGSNVVMFQYGSGTAIYGAFGTKYMPEGLREAMNRSLEKVNGKLSA